MKPKYPIEGYGNQKKKFRKLLRELDLINERSEWQALLSRRLDEIFENKELWAWLNKYTNISYKKIPYILKKNQNMGRPKKVERVWPDTRSPEL